MDEKNEKLPEDRASEESVYTPRPAWQVWCARVGLVIFLLIVIGQMLRIARGGF